MRYERSDDVAGCCEPKEMRGVTCAEKPPAVPLAEMMVKSRAVESDILAMAERIGVILFGENRARCSVNKENSPMCLRDDLEEQHHTLCEAADILRFVLDQLGV